MKNNRIAPLDFVIFIIFIIFLIGLDFKNMRATDWATLIACLLWLVLFIIRQILLSRGAKND